LDHPWAVSAPIAGFSRRRIGRNGFPESTNDAADGHVNGQIDGESTESRL
jgi:hypothetical protein